MDITHRFDGVYSGLLDAHVCKWCDYSVTPHAHFSATGDEIQAAHAYYLERPGKPISIQEGAVRYRAMIAGARKEEIVSELDRRRARLTS